MDIEEFIDYLKEKGFDEISKNSHFYGDERRNKKTCMRYHISLMAYHHFTGKKYEADFYPGYIYVFIHSQDDIEINFGCSYYNEVNRMNDDLDTEYCYAKTYDEAVEFIDKCLSRKDNPITKEMCETILFYNGERLPEEALNDIMNEDDRYVNDFDRFLEDCGFETIEEYEEYVSKLEVEY